MVVERPLYLPVMAGHSRPKLAYARPSTSSLLNGRKDVDARDKPGHDEVVVAANQALSPAGENRYPPPLMVRITAGLVGSTSILRRIRMIRRSTARSKASASRGLANSSSRSRDSTRLGLAANTFKRPNSEAVS